MEIRKQQSHCILYYWKTLYPWGKKTTYETREDVLVLERIGEEERERIEFGSVLQIDMK